MSTANVSRRNFLKAGGALVVSFSAMGSASEVWAQGPGPFDTHESNVDPKKLDSWIAVHGDGTAVAARFGHGRPGHARRQWRP